MATLPLFDTPAEPDAWHHVAAPGGYELWHFDAVDASGGLRIVVDVGEGLSFDRSYLRRYLRYRRNPTRHRPPAPGECPFVYLALYEKGRLVAHVKSRLPAGALNASADGVGLTIGGSRLTRDPDGTVKLHTEGAPRHLAWRGWRDTPGGRVIADLTFRPLLRAAPRERDYVAPHLAGGAVHRWVIVHPLCAVEGTVRIVGEAGSNGQSREVAFAGRGFHDHRYGTTPLDLGVGPRGQLWGHALFDAHAYVLYAAGLANPARRDGGESVFRLVRADAHGVREVDQGRPMVPRWGMGTAAVAWADEIGFGSRLRLTEPAALALAPYGMCLSFVAEEGDGGERGIALCQASY